MILDSSSVGSSRRGLGGGCKDRPGGFVFVYSIRLWCSLSEGSGVVSKYHEVLLPPSYLIYH